MEVTVSVEDRYVVTPDGSVWTHGATAQHFWERYLAVFDAVRIVARAAQAEEAPEGSRLVTGKHISLCGLPDYCGPFQYIKRYPALRAAIGSATPGRGAVIMRVVSQVANMLESRLQAQNHPYALEIVGDPYEVFARGAVDHPFRPFFRWHFVRHMRRQCRHALGVAYVTKRVLQDRYPAKAPSMNIADMSLPPHPARGQTVTTHYSSVELNADSILQSIRTPKQHGPYRLVTVGSLAQRYKGTDVLIDAVARCTRAGLDLTAVVVGEGTYRPELMSQAERAGVAARIQFCGQITPGEPVRNILDTADLFVLPSRTEGLPRAMIEAMARGLPCIGSAVGGIPELLEASDLVPAGDSATLAEKIHDVLKNPSRMETMSRRNLEASRQFCDSVLSERRRRFYEYVRDYTENWKLWPEV